VRRATFTKEAPMERMSISEYRRIMGVSSGPPITSATQAKHKAVAPKAERGSLARILAPILIGKLVLKPEERIAVEFGALLRGGALTGQLKGIFCHVPNEIAGKRQSRTAQIRYTIAKAMGLIEGAPDYLFLWNGGSGALEAKTDQGRQTEGQFSFEVWCKREGAPYRVFRTPEEGLQILGEWGVWRSHIP